MLKEQIIEAVEALRIRKCRPDRETIAHYCTRKFGVKFQEVFTELENIVDQGGLLKVEYKGSMSYRSPSQFSSKSSPLLTKHSKILNSSRTSRLVITAVSELLNEHQEWNTEGIPPKELETKLISFDAERFKTGPQLQTILDREISQGNLVVSKKSGRIFPKDLLPKDAVLPEQKSSGRRSGGLRVVRSRRVVEWPEEPNDSNEEPEAGTSKSKAGEGEEERKDVVEKLAAAVRKTYGFARNATNAAAGGTSTSPGSGNASDSSASARTPSPNTRAAVAAGAAAGGRQSARNKRKKEVFDPSDPPPPKQRHSSSACKVCSKEVEKEKVGKGAGVAEDTSTLTCTICAGQYHSACVPAEARPNSTTPSAPTPPAGGRTRSTRRSAVAAATPTPPPANAAAVRQAPWTCPGCKECDICGGGGNKAIGEEDLTDYACSNRKCDSVVTLHEGCIVGAAADARKCIKCGVGVVGPPAVETEADNNAATAAATEKKTPAKRERGSPKKAVTAKKKKNEITEAPASEAEVETPAPVEKVEIKEDDGAEKEIKAEAVSAAEPSTAEVNAIASANSTSDLKSKTEENESEAILMSISQASTEPVEWPSQNGNGNGDGNNETETEGEKSRAAESETVVGTSKVANISAASASEEEVEVFTMVAEEEAETEVDDHGGAQNNGGGSGSAGPKAVQKVGDAEPEDATPVPNPAQAASWTPTEVEAFFRSKGLVEEGAVFREQEIDGVALLLMRRDDIVHGMKFLLGPALKIYRHILELQQAV